jgi:putative ABC transport system ATP-binding protein
MSENTATPIVQAVQLTKEVPQAREDGTEPLVLLHEIEFAIAPGSTVAIVGPSGSGKSTLLGLLAGLDNATRGQVLIDGVDLSKLSEDQRAALRGEKIGFVFQTFQLLPNLTAIENVMLPLEILGRTDAQATATAVLERVGLGHRLHHYPKQLSGGEQQRVAIARAFAPRPRLLFADEPTGNLDRATGARVMELLFALNAEQRTTLVLVTHDESLAARCGTRLELDAGKMRNP